MLLAKRTGLIKESPTFAILAKANLMKKNGADVVVLAAGEPDFDTPQHIKDAAIKAINEGKTKYTPVGGTISLKQALVDKYKRENEFDYTAKQVIVSSGGKHCIYNFLQAIINDGDEVIIPAPYWVSYPDMVLLAGGTPIIAACGMEDSFKLSARKLKRLITSKTKALFLNSPSNPTGMIYAENELREIADVLLDNPHVLVISDDLYEHLLFDSSKKFQNILNIEPKLYDRVVLINGASKAYSMTGWRIGFAACGNEAIIKAMDNIQSQSTSNPCSISQYAAEAALNGGLDCVKPMLAAFIERHKYVVDRLNKIRGIKCLPAQGAFYAFFDCSEAIEILVKDGKINEKTDLAFANYLLENYLVAGVPGSAFGLDKHMRISFATGMNELEKALDRIEEALK